jgi:tRNA threonylcarbamoyladenosine biosynthesis protein TsaB
LTILYIDSTYDITIGVLDQKLGWKVLETFTGQKASSVLQKETYKHLDQLGLSLKSLKSIVTVAGPGFYTGIRLSEGFADVLSFTGIPHYSFYSHSIPSFLGFCEGVWLTKAYRGEYFFHSWSETERKDELVQLKDLNSYIEKLHGKKLFVHSQSAIDEHIKKHNLEMSITTELLSESPHFIFEKVLASSLKSESFYFRAPEDEFKANP